VLPSMLQSAAPSALFSCTTLFRSVGVLSVQVTATDLSGASASSAFALNVANVNDAPTVAHAIADQSATQDAAFSFIVPSDTFADIDLAHLLCYHSPITYASVFFSS